MKFLNKIYQKSIDKENEYLKYKMLFGLVYFKYNNISKTFNFRLFGMPIFRSKLKGYYKKYYFLFMPILFLKATREFLINFYDEIIDKFPNYDDYYVFLSRSGEFFLLMHHLDEWLKKNKSSNFILIFSAKYHLNICKMFFPNAHCAYIKRVNVPIVSRGIKTVKNIYKSKNIYVPTCEKYFVDVENKIRDKNKHYYELLKSHLSISDNTRHGFISSEAKDKAYKIAKYFLDDNFILISPETLSNEPMEKISGKICVVK